IIGTVCDKLKDDKDTEIIVLTGDKDTLQLISNNIKVYTFKTGISDIVIYDRDTVKDRMGIYPEQVIDYKALRGDQSDNIPGVKGIGEKTAVELLNKFGNINNLYKSIESNSISDEIKPRILGLLKSQKEQAFLSYNLSKIDKNVNIEFNLEECIIKPIDLERLRKIFIDLEFKTLLDRILELDIIPKPENKNIQGNNTEYIFLKNDGDILKVFKELESQEEFAFDTEADGVNSLVANIVGFSFCFQEGHAYYIDYNTIKNNIKIFNKIKNIFEDKNIKKIGHNIKYDIHILKRLGINVENTYFDTMIAAYILYPGERKYNIDSLVFSEFGFRMQRIEELIGENKKTQITMNFVDPNKVASYCCEDSDFAFRLYKKYFLELKKIPKFFDLFFTIEMPLINILVSMEENGILLDVNYLNELSLFYEDKIKEIEKYIFDITGPFNLNSPKQLQEILYNKLKLDIKGIRKIKTGISTASDELERLRDNLLDEAEEIVENNQLDNSLDTEIINILSKIIEYREYQKLKTTYIDNLPLLINKNTNRIHTNFNQVITSTGRLSSSDPNLQNIPVRTEDGKKIRKAFIAEKGYKLVSIDYSQIELRVIAALANEKNMIDAFNKNLDIHAVTASIINNIKLEDVTREQRRDAKSINFGIIYGMGPRKLARTTGLSFKDAKEYIDKYFQVNRNIEKYINEVINFAKENGYSENILGRRRYLKDINSNQSQIRSQAERMAQNMPIQSLAADIMKMAMKKVFDRINNSKEKDNIRMLLQVHDELVFEVREGSIYFMENIKDDMENVFILPNNVKLKAEIEVGDNWGEMN
ncbi:DNA polymerase I, partial [Patescibacteria group bacterium]|nr:DNA polymerase I [Patescibacteria group bacterium]